MMRQFEMVERVASYDPDVDEDALNRGYVYAMKMHGSQLRASGDPYFSHPVEVAGILTKYKLDSASIITALLHDTIEDTSATYEDIKHLFGEEVANLVEGVTKLTRLELQSDKTMQAENFRKLVMAMSEDIRVLLVKLADRMHNMRTLHYIKKPEKRQRIALETMEIYAPLAERLGMQEMKTELEDLSFAQLHTDARESILTRLKFLRQQSGNIIPRIIKQLKDILVEVDIRPFVSGREKTPYSIWRKMQRQNIAFEQLSDIIAFRVMVPTVEDCYKALGTIHSKYPMVPGMFTDYMSTPKANGYQSLHTGVIGPEKHRIEIQIRTHDMHEIAENGVAAHWSYKQGERNTDGRQFKWLRELLDILEGAAGPEEFLEHTKLEMFQDQVFCFSPKGDLITLPSGATPVDFAYAVHSGVGNACVGAKINGHMRHLRSVLQNGDQVEILTSKAQTPSAEWERFVVTGKARACIRKFIRTQKRNQYIELGKQILQRAYKQEKYEFSEKSLLNVLKKFEKETSEDLIVSVGEGRISGQDVVMAVFPGIKTNRLRQVVQKLKKTKKRKSKSEESSIHINGLIPGMALHFAGCCHPLPGDRIVGIVTTGKGVTVHTIDCPTLEKFSSEPERWLDISWGDEVENMTHIARIRVELLNEQGALAELSTVIAKNVANITNLNIVSRSINFYELLVDIEVQDVRHLSNTVAALRACPLVNSVERTRS
ncbi:MAG: bifunctional (p)ppGpp synthetase/guanosine-3',5'-bis(diphosphate) 3'-pyrophosphohydrolase [Alphaproteobacteria bacterium]|nr:bifunctional (p)ppGpp synthetase/guanosine-3',5'-bis(diphosphate) 3'-pyrophosphohydrolase [Alphaproteobacteria bacterium]